MARNHPIIAAFVDALKQARFDGKRVCAVSDVLWKKELGEQLGIDLFHVVRGRAVAFATGLKLGNPKLKVTVFAGDLATLGGNHLVHSARRNMDLLVIALNSFIYPKIRRKAAPRARPAFSMYENIEQPFNLPHLAASCGAVYVARWTALHKPNLAGSIREALAKRGFSLIEVLAPGSNYFAGTEALDNQAAILEFYYQNSEIRDGEDTSSVSIEPSKPILVGKFVDAERVGFIDSYNAQLGRTLGDKFRTYK
jgi:2-oxoglutarate ferredoxin oxidoreductase subunit beta